MSDTLSLTDVQRQVLRHLGEPLTVVQIAHTLGISDKRVYQLMNQLTAKGLLRDDLPPEAAVRATYPARTVKERGKPAPVLVGKVTLSDGSLFVVQAALLDDWEGRTPNEALPADKVIAIRDLCSGAHWAFIASRRYRWSTANTQNAVRRGWSTDSSWCYTDIIALTLTIARVLEVKALIVPLVHDIRGTNGNG